MTPTPVGPTPRPDVHPVAPGTHLLFAQSGRIEHVPLDGYTMRKQEAKPLLHVPVRQYFSVLNQPDRRNGIFTCQLDVFHMSMERKHLKRGGPLQSFFNIFFFNMCGAFNSGQIRFLDYQRSQLVTAQGFPLVRGVSRDAGLVLN